jgi:hypothetical protein
MQRLRHEGIEPEDAEEKRIAKSFIERGPLCTPPFFLCDLCVALLLIESFTLESEQTLKD